VSGTDNRQPHPPCDVRCDCGCHANDEATYRPVDGICPACGKQYLGIAVWHRSEEASRVHCWNILCPDPKAVWKILNRPDTDHVAWFGQHGWTLQHPLKERVDDKLASCPATAWMQRHIPAEADRPGLYRMTEDGDGWCFAPLEGMD